MLLSSLLRWYLNHGLVITKIHQVIEYKPSKCFTNFAKEVSDSRRMGDNNSEYALLAETCKLAANSAYGKFITAVEKFVKYEYVMDDDQKVSKLLNSHNFLSFNEMKNDLYEFEMCPKKTNINIPVHLGFSILCYAKLRMLEFYYNFLVRFIPKSEFQVMCMDTDSLYLALTADSLEELVP